MCDQDHFEQDREEFEALGLVTRKQFGMLLGAGIAMILPSVANAATVTEAEVNVMTPDGTADCYFVHPSTGTAPGVLMWPEFSGCGRRSARWGSGWRIGLCGAGGESVLPREEGAGGADSATPIPQLLPLAQALNETTHMTDAKAFIGWLDQQAAVAKNRKMGTQGYCMGGPMAFRTAAAMPGRVGAVATFHGGGLVTDMPNSPHLQTAKTKVQFLIAIAENDDMRSPNEKNVLKETFEGKPPRGNRSLYGFCARLVPTGFAGLQRGQGREGMGPSAGPVRKSVGLSPASISPAAGPGNMPRDPGGPLDSGFRKETPRSSPGKTLRISQCIVREKACRFGIGVKDGGPGPNFLSLPCFWPPTALWVNGVLPSTTTAMGWPSCGTDWPVAARFRLREWQCGRSGLGGTSRSRPRVAWKGLYAQCPPSGSGRGQRVLRSNWNSILPALAACAAGLHRRNLPAVRVRRAALAAAPIAEAFIRAAMVAAGSGP